MKIDPLIGIVSVLLQRGMVTAPELAEQFEVSRRTINRDIETLCKAGYFPYVVPPLEGLWQQHGAEAKGVDYAHKENFEWTAMIRLPDFATEKTLAWAVWEASAKKNRDFSNMQFFSYQEDFCVQCMHIGSYDDEPATIRRMHAFFLSSPNLLSGDNIPHAI